MPMPIEGEEQDEWKTKMSQLFIKELHSYFLFGVREMTFGPIWCRLFLFPVNFLKFPICMVEFMIFSPLFVLFFP
jgi:hypothetical protein